MSWIWLWILVSVISGSIGDLLMAYGMARYGAIQRFDASGLKRELLYIATNKPIVLGILANAVSFVTFMALLSLVDLSFAVPVTAIGYILRTVLAKIYLKEYVSPKRWAGAVLVSIGVLLISI